MHFLILLCLSPCDLTRLTRNSPHTPSIHILDDDSLINIFYLYRLAILPANEDEDNDIRIYDGMGWDRERWWYKLAHVSQGWRSLILGSASYLDLCLVCTYGTPVADMLAHSPHFPLVIDYVDPNQDITAEEEGIILALEQRDRVRRVRLEMPLPNLQKLIMAIDEEYPLLEYLIMSFPIEDKSTVVMLPETLQAPHLRRLMLEGFALPRESRLLTTATGLIALALSVGHPTAYFQPNILLHWLSFMPQLEMLAIAFYFPVPNRDMEGQLVQTTQATLPNLRWLDFRGVSAYMEAFVRQITTPRLKRLSIKFFTQLTFFVPHLQHFMNTTENLRLDSAKFTFSRDGVYVRVYPRGDEMYTLRINVHCLHLDWQVSSMAQIFNPLTQIFSTVEHLTLQHKVQSLSSEVHNEVDRIEWRKLLRSFSNVNSLHVDNGLVKELSRGLRLEDGEHPLELLPELQELTYSGSGDTGGAFKSFIDARQNAAHPVTLTRRRRR